MRFEDLSMEPSRRDETNPASQEGDSERCTSGNHYRKEERVWNAAWSEAIRDYSESFSRRAARMARASSAIDG